MTKIKTPLERAMALAAVSGLRATLGPALLKSSRRDPTSGYWILGTLGEMFLDKTGLLPARHRPALMIPRALAGAWVANETMKGEGIDDPSAPVMGAVVAAGVAGVAPVVRTLLNRGLGVSDPVLGLAEDYLALKLGGEATGMTFNQMGECAREAVEDLRDQVAPGLELPELPKVGV